MRRVLFWKEYREQRIQIVALTVLTVMSLTLGVPLLDIGMTIDHSVIMTFAMLFAWSCGMVTGAILLANEAETATQTFLDTLPRWRRQLWLNKLAFGGVVTIFQMIIIAAACLAIGTKYDSVTGVMPYLELAGMGFLGLGCGLVGSALGRSVLAAVGWSIVVAAVNFAVHFAIYWLMFWIGDFVLSIRGGPDTFIAEYTAGTLVAISGVVLPFFVSMSIYTRVDTKRRASERFLGMIRRGAARVGWGIKATLWMSLKQSALVYAVLGVAALIIGPMMLVEPAMAWPAVTLLVGAIAGVTTFADEQRLGSFRFLAEQRLPLGRLWCWKVASRFVLAVVVGLALLLAAFGALAIVSELAGPGGLRFANNFAPQNRGEADFILIENLGRGFFFVWLTYGFAFGLLGGMVARKTFLALAFALPAAVLALLPWVPTLFGGGMPVWELFVVPVGALLLARLSVWPWATERIFSRSNLLRWGAAAALAVAWIVVCLGYRVWEVPRADEPFDVAVFRGGYRDLEKSAAPSLIRTAANQRDVHINKLIETGALPLDFNTTFVEDFSRARAGLPNPSRPQAPGDRNQPEVFTFDQRILAVSAFGWRAADQAFGHQLDLICGGEWLETLEKAAPLPLGVFQTPIANFPTPAMRVFAQPLTARALQLHDQGDPAAALHLFTVQLAIARHGMSRAATLPYLQALSVETSALRGMELWGATGTVPPPLLERALAELQLHERSRPTLEDAAKVDYLVTLDSFTTPQRNRPRPFSDAQWKDVLLLTPMVAPWERARRMRIFNGYTSFGINAIKSDFPTLLARARARNGGRYDDQQEYLNLGWLPFGENDLENQERELLVGMLHSDPTVRTNVSVITSGLTTKAVTLCRVRAAQLRMALLIYQHRHGRPAEQLTDLVPEILGELPLDPFTNGPFYYRVSNGEMLEWQRELSIVGGNDQWTIQEWDVVAPGGPGGAPPDLPAVGGAGDLPVKHRSARSGEIATHRRVQPGEGVLWACGVDGINHGGTHQTVHEGNGMSAAYAAKSAGPDMIFVIPKFGKK